MIAQTMGHFVILLVRNRAVIAVTAFAAGAVLAHLSVPVESAAQWGAGLIEWLGSALAPGGR